MLCRYVCSAWTRHWQRLTLAVRKNVERQQGRRLPYIARLVATPLRPRYQVPSRGRLGETLVVAGWLSQRNTRWQTLKGGCYAYSETTDDLGLHTNPPYHGSHACHEARKAPFPRGRGRPTRQD